MATASQESSPSTRLETKDKITHGLLSYDNIPPWYQDNDCIRHGYRPVMNNIKTCVESWTYLHNETANIYSHLVPAVLAIVSQGFIYRSYSRYYPQAATRDYLIVAFHLGSTSICFGLSAFYHTLMNHSAPYSDLWAVWTTLASSYSFLVTSCPASTSAFIASRCCRTPTGQ